MSCFSREDRWEDGPHILHYYHYIIIAFLTLEPSVGKEMGGGRNGLLPLFYIGILINKSDFGPAAPLFRVFIFMYIYVCVMDPAFEEKHLLSLYIYRALYI